jgi:hypothetical protein
MKLMERTAVIMSSPAKTPRIVSMNRWIITQERRAEQMEMFQHADLSDDDENDFPLTFRTHSGIYLLSNTRELFNEVFRTDPILHRCNHSSYDSSSENDLRHHAHCHARFRAVPF